MSVMLTRREADSVCRVQKTDILKRVFPIFAETCQSLQLSVLQMERCWRIIADQDPQSIIDLIVSTRIQAGAERNGVFAFSRYIHGVALNESIKGRLAISLLAPLNDNEPNRMRMEFGNLQGVSILKALRASADLEALDYEKDLELIQHLREQESGADWDRDLSSRAFLFFAHKAFDAGTFNHLIDKLQTGVLWGHFPNCEHSSQIALAQLIQDALENLVVSNISNKVPARFVLKPRRKINFQKLIINYCFDRKVNELESEFIAYLIYSKNFELIFNHLMSYHIIIDMKVHFENYYALKARVLDQLSPLFDCAHYPESERDTFVARLLSAVFQAELEKDSSTTLSIEAPALAATSDGPSLPDVAPQLWSSDRLRLVDAETGRSRRETAKEFTLRVYGPWLGQGLTRNTIRKIDNPLFQALYRAYGTNLPDELPLPTIKENNDLWVERVREKGIKANLPEGSEAILREARRLRYLLHERPNRDAAGK